MNIIDLNGKWKLRWWTGGFGDNIEKHARGDAELDRAFSATVPGEVHADLIKAGIIPEPYYGVDLLKSRWVEEMFWIYTREFAAPKLIKGERAFLVFSCLDLAAIMYLNGKKIAEHSNSFLPLSVDVTDCLKTKNVLHVQLDSGVHKYSDKDVSGYATPKDLEFTKKVWTRKPQNQHSWDWGPRYLNVGIQGDVSLEIASGARAGDVTVLASLNDELSAGYVTVRAFAETFSKGTLSVVAEIPEAGVKFSGKETVKKGECKVEAFADVARPLLWWPRGHGGQPLYTVKITVFFNGKPVKSFEKKIGFRHVRVNQDAKTSGGRYFTFEINKKKIFCKGANLIPEDLIMARVPGKRMRKLFALALESNFNMLRVWGGGVYESDEFYDLCDKQGMLVWQEFIFACSKYPAQDPEFCKSVQDEAVYHVRRLSNRASLVAWCGNNEIESGYFDWANFQGEPYRPDQFLYHTEFPQIVIKEDGTRYYQASSPISPDSKLNPNDNTCGDQHPWNVTFGTIDYREYRDYICTFANEGGVMGPTSLPNMKACLLGGTGKYGSFEWEFHDNQLVTAMKNKNAPDRMLLSFTGKKTEDLSLADYVYWGGALQGEALSEYIKNFRRRMFDSSSAIFWMYNDIWPVTRGWCTVDWMLNRTPSFYPVKRYFAPVICAVARDGDRLSFFAVNEGPELTVSVRYGIFNVNGKYPVNSERELTLPANTNTKVAEMPFSAFEKLGLTEHLAFIVLSKDGKVIAKDRLMMPKFVEMKLGKGKIRIENRKGETVLKSDKYVWNVCVDLDGKAVADNFFDLFPGIPEVLDGQVRVIKQGN